MMYRQPRRKEKTIWRYTPRRRRTRQQAPGGGQLDPIVRIVMTEVRVGALMISMDVGNRGRNTCAPVASAADNVTSMAGDGTGSFYRDRSVKADMRFKIYLHLESGFLVAF